MSDEFRYRRRIEFCETDAAGIAHFSAFFQYMEQAEHALLRHVGTNVVYEDDEGLISWPRVSASCDYAGSVRFEDVMEVVVHVARLGAKSVTYAFDFHSNDEIVASGKMTTVCCRIQHTSPPESIAIPSWLVEQLRTFEAT
ncbi:MAG: 4-hydroxybenzoyl-CoA thioesterase [Planctomycetaceae bacterium]|nr:4-hydroxybenzoyl-CoA thioesterase [Planctomycetaceae bacterium]